MSALSNTKYQGDTFTIIYNHPEPPSDHSSSQQSSHSIHNCPDSPNTQSGRKGRRKNRKGKKDGRSKKYSLQSKERREMAKRRLIDEEEQRNEIAMWEEFLQVEIDYCKRMNYVELLKIFVPEGIGQEQELKEGPFEPQEERQMVNATVTAEAPQVETIEVVPPPSTITPILPLPTQRQPEEQDYYFSPDFQFESEEYHQNSQSFFFFNHRDLGKGPQ